MRRSICYWKNQLESLTTKHQKVQYSSYICIALWLKKINHRFLVIVGTRQLLAQTWRNLSCGFWKSSEIDITLLKKENCCRPYLLCLDQRIASRSGSSNFTMMLIGLSYLSVLATMSEPFQHYIFWGMMDKRGVVVTLSSRHQEI